MAHIFWTLKIFYDIIYRKLGEFEGPSWRFIINKNLRRISKNSGGVQNDSGKNKEFEIDFKECSGVAI